MLKKLYNSGWFDYREFIIDNQKKLSLTSTESLILIHLLNKYRYSIVFDKDELKEHINVRKDIFENALGNLLSRGLFEIYLKDSDGKSFEAFSMDGFFERSMEILEDKIVVDEDTLYTILKSVSKALNKVLSGNEVEIIKSLYIDDRYTLDDFNLAFSKLNDKKIKNIRTLTLELEALRNKPIKESKPQFLDDFLKQVK